MTIAVICILIYIFSFPMIKRLMVLCSRYNRRIHKIKGEHYTPMLIKDDGTYYKGDERYFFLILTSFPFLQQIVLLMSIIMYFIYLITYFNVKLKYRIKQKNASIYFLGIDVGKVSKFISKFSTFRP